MWGTYQCHVYGALRHGFEVNSIVSGSWHLLACRLALCPTDLQSGVFMVGCWLLAPCRCVLGVTAVLATQRVSLRIGGLRVAFVGALTFVCAELRYKNTLYILRYICLLCVWVCMYMHIYIYIWRACAWLVSVRVCARRCSANCLKNRRDAQKYKNVLWSYTYKFATLLLVFLRQPRESDSG